MSSKPCLFRGRRSRVVVQTRVIIAMLYTGLFPRVVDSVRRAWGFSHADRIQRGFEIGQNLYEFDIILEFEIPNRNFRL